jgi:hypothetical protein
MNTNLLPLLTAATVLLAGCSGWNEADPKPVGFNANAMEGGDAATPGPTMADAGSKPTTTPSSSSGESGMGGMQGSKTGSSSSSTSGGSGSMGPGCMMGGTTGNSSGSGTNTSKPDAGVATPAGDGGTVSTDPVLGGPCDGTTVCPIGPSGTAKCLTDWPEGACVIEDCAAHADDCPGGGHCVLAPTARCLAGCTTSADCRTGYECASKSGNGHGTFNVCVVPGI